MSVTETVRSPAEYEERLQKYLYERSEEGRAVRVGEKEVSEQAEIVVRYADLFSRAQLAALRECEDEAADADDRERLYRLRKTCEGGLVAAELAEPEDELENRILAARITLEGRGDAASERAGAARSPLRLRRPRAARASSRPKRPRNSIPTASNCWRRPRRSRPR